MIGVTFDSTPKQLPLFSYSACWDRAVQLAKAEAQLHFPPEMEAARRDKANELAHKYYRQLAIPQCRGQV